MSVPYHPVILPDDTPKLGTWCRSVAFKLPETGEQIFMLGRWDVYDDEQKWVCHKIAVNDRNWREIGEPIQMSSAQLAAQMDRFERGNAPLLSQCEDRHEQGDAHYDAFFSAELKALKHEYCVAPRKITVGRFYMHDIMAAFIPPAKWSNITKKQLRSYDISASVLKSVSFVSQMVRHGRTDPENKLFNSMLWETRPDSVNIRNMLDLGVDITASDDTIRAMAWSPYLRQILQYFKESDDGGLIDFQPIKDRLNKHWRIKPDQFERITELFLNYRSNMKQIGPLLCEVLNRADAGEAYYALHLFPDKLIEQLDYANPAKLASIPGHSPQSAEALRYMLDIDMAQDGTLVSKTTKQNILDRAVENGEHLTKPIMRGYYPKMTTDTKYIPRPSWRLSVKRIKGEIDW